MKRYKYRLEFEVNYKTNQTSKNELRDILYSVTEYAANRGLLTGETDAEVTGTATFVTCVDPKQERYILDCGANCPFCHKPATCNLDTYEYHCLNCDGKWEDVKELKGFRVIKKPETKKIP